MKNYKIHILLLLVLFTFGCTELDEEPVGVLAPEGFFQSEKEVELAIFGAIGKISADDYWGREMSLAITLRGDMVDIGNRGTVAARIQINDFVADGFNSVIGRFWEASYSIIGTVNTAIAGAEQLEESQKLTELVAEARFFRAFAYFNLVRLFGDIPYIAEAISDPESLGDISKTSEADVYANIIADLEFAKTNLPMDHTGNTRNRPSKGSAYAMLADVQLTLSNWQEAYNNAKWVISNATTLDYGLEPNYQDLFDATKQYGMAEHIFCVDFKGQRSQWPYNVDSHPAFTGAGGTKWNGWDVTVPALAVWEKWDKRDYRRKVAFADSLLVGDELTPYTEWNIPRPHIAKYRRFPGNSEASGNTSDNNYAIYRYAEVLLTAAEALNEVSGPTAEAIGYVNQVRERARNWAGTPTDFPADVAAGISKDDFLDLILNERRLELSFEFKRWWDIKRRSMGNEVFKGQNSLEPHDNFNDNQYLFPIPQDEIDKNPNITQNSGYN